MRSKKKLHNIFYSGNYNNLYKGISGFFFKKAHENLEKISTKVKAQNILEIGPGRQPHYNYISNKSFLCSYDLLEKDIKVQKFLKKKFKETKNIKIINRISKSKKYDRIILSHVLEHVINPENFLNNLISKLKKNGSISITIPCDPGLFWEVGRFYNYLTFWRKKNIIHKEYLYHMANEHINPVLNLIRIINYRFKKESESFLPFRIKSINFNLFYNVTIKK